MKVFSNTTPFIALAAVDLLKARKAGLIASFRHAADLMRVQGVFYNLALIERLAGTVGE